jgi:H+/Cl- antiporter ClcA
MNTDKIHGVAGMIGGSVLSVIVTFDFSQLANSILLGIVATAVSYFTSKALKALFENDPST